MQSNVLLKNSKHFFDEKHHFSWKISSFEVLRLHKQEQFLKRLLRESFYVECFCKVARIFRIKTFSFSKKNENFEILENSWAVVKFETHFDKKTCEIKRFRKFSLGFIEKIYLLFKKKKSYFFEKSRAVGFFGRPSRWNLPCLMFLKTCEDFFDHSNFFAKKNIFERFLSTLKQ